MEELQGLIDKRSSLQDQSQGKFTRMWDPYRFGRSGLDSLRGKITFHNSAIEVFLLSLQGGTHRKEH